MQGHEVKRPPYGLDVTLPAAVTSIEYGVALYVLYFLVRSRLPKLSVLAKTLLLAALGLALEGNLFRMPIMQLVIGNPLSVVVVQQGSVWLTWVAACFALVFTFEAMAKHDG